MMIRRRPTSFLSCVALSVLLSACATPTPPPAQPEQATTKPGAGLYKVGNPYQVNGIWYYPAEDFNYDETGIASWYGPNFDQKFTANGEVFDQNLVSAAHKTLPLPTVVQVTNLDNGRSIQVRINDRGPYVGTRIIDMSRRAAQLLGFEQQGTAKVRVKIMVPDTIQAQSLAKLNGGEGAPVAIAPPAPRDTVVAQALPPPTASHNLPPPPPAPPQPAPKVQPLPAPSPMALSPAAAKDTVAPANTLQPPSNAVTQTALLPPSSSPPLVSPPLPQTVTVVQVKATHIFIQAGAFASGTNATRMKAKLEGLGPVVVSGTRVNGIDLYRVRLGPISTVDDADALLARAVSAGATEAKIVVD